MIHIQFPDVDFRIQGEKGKEVIFDPCRKRWVSLTPEEWVRQNFIQYLVKVMQMPPSLIAIEKEIYLGELKKRFDIVVYKDAQPWMIVECKEPNVPLSEAVLRQVLNYNISLKLPYLVITNGKTTFALDIQNGHHQWLSELPSFIP